MRRVCALLAGVAKVLLSSVAGASRQPPRGARPRVRVVVLLDLLCDSGASQEAIIRAQRRPGALRVATTGACTALSRRLASLEALAGDHVCLDSRKLGGLLGLDLRPAAELHEVPRAR